MATTQNKKGVDISTWQGDIDLKKVKAAGYDFVMIRCGQGKEGRIDDNQFAANVKKAEAIGMPWGTYLLTEAASTADALSEAAHVDRLLREQKAKGYLPTMPVALDIEWEEHIVNKGGWNKANVSNITKVFLDEIKRLGYYPMLYTGGSELNSLMDDYIRTSFDVWFAQWYTSPTDYKYKRLGIWQYGGETNYLDGNSIPGVGVIDKDLCYKDYPTIIKQGGYNGWPKGSPVTPDPPVTPTKKVKTLTLTFNYLGKNYESPTGQTRTVQRILKTCNYKGKDGKVLSLDGVFGDNTEYAVIAYQKKHNLTADGVVGPHTWKALTGAK